MPKKTPKKVATMKIPKTTSPKPKPAKVNKSATIRSFPKSMPAADVVASMAKRGVTVSTNVVYAVRSTAKKPKGRKRAGGRVSTIPIIASAGGSGGLVAEIERLVEAKVRELLRGKVGDLFV